MQPYNSAIGKYTKKTIQMTSSTNMAPITIGGHTRWTSLRTDMASTPLVSCNRYRYVAVGCHQVRWSIGRCVLRARWPGVAPRPNERTGGSWRGPSRTLAFCCTTTRDAKSFRAELERRRTVRSLAMASRPREVYPLADHCQFDILQSGPGW